MRVAIACSVAVLVACAVAPARGDDFNIASLPGLQWWASAQDSQLAQNPDGTGAVGNGNPVGFIADLSGNGNDAVMGNAVPSGGDNARPILQTGVVGRHPGIYYNAASISLLPHLDFNGDTSATLILAVELLPTSDYLAGRGLFGTSGAGIGVTANYQFTSGLQLANGDAPSAIAPGGVTGGTLDVLAARFQTTPTGGVLDFWLNGSLVQSTQLNSAVSPIADSGGGLLGNRKNQNPAQYYFLEGLATNTALSNSQIQQVSTSLAQKWPGVEMISISANIYSGAPHIEGMAAGGGSYYVFNTGTMSKYDANWNLLTSNQALTSGINPPATHCGDGDYMAGRLFAPLESDLNGGNKYIAVYDATKPGLPLVVAKSIAEPHEFSALVVVPNAGSDGVMFATSYYANSGGDRLWMYNYADGNVASSQFGSFLGTLQLPSAVTNIQGIAWKAPYFYFSSNNYQGSNYIVRALFQNGALLNSVEPVLPFGNTVQGLAFDGSNLWQTVQASSTGEYARQLSSASFQELNPAAFQAWNVNSNGAYGNAANWNAPVPNAPGAAVLLGDGAENRVHANAVQVTVDAGYTIGSLSLENISGTSYTLAGDGVAGHGLTLTSGAGSGAGVNVYAGNHTISANLTLADPGGHLFNIASGSTLTVNGSIGESGGSRSLTMNDAGTLVLAGTNSFSGGTTVRFGTLQTTASGALGSGPLTMNASANMSSAVSIGGAESVSGLAGTVQSGGSTTLTVAPHASLTVSQTGVSTFAGNLVNSGAFAMSGSGVLEMDAAPTLNATSSLQINSGTLRFNLNSGAATVQAGASATVTGSATLELAGTVSALSSPDAAANRVHVVNSSNAIAGGLYVSGNNQQVGGIDGGGSVVIGAGADLTVDHIVQSSLVIGSGGTFTLAPSGAAGNPLDSAGGFVLAGSLESSVSMVTPTTGSRNLRGAAASSDSAPMSALPATSGTLSVPEPDSLVALLGGSAAWLVGQRVRAVRGMSRRNSRCEADQQQLS